MVKTSRWPVSHLPISNIQPFTYRDGETYLSLLNRLAEYITAQLHPNLRKTVEDIVEEMEHILAAQHGKYVEGVQDFQRIHDAFMTDVNSALMALNDNAVSDLVQDTGTALGKTLRELFTAKDEFDGLATDFQNHYDTMVEGLRLQSVTPQEFGATGDGQTDDTVALQETIEHAEQTGTQVRLLPGVYRITDTLHITKPIQIYGAPQGKTVIDIASVSEGKFGILLFGDEHIHRVVFNGFDIEGSTTRQSSGIAFGSDGVDSSIRHGVSAFTVDNVRINNVRIGIRARFSWMGEFTNVQIALSDNPLVLGSQVNALTFNTCTIRSFTGSSMLTNCETILFNNLNLVHAGAYNPAFSLQQSNVTFVNPYFEYVNLLANVGRPSDIIKSSFVTLGGRVCGRLHVGTVDGVIDIQSPWYVRMGLDPYYGEHFTYPEEKLLVSANSGNTPAYPSRFISIDRDRSTPIGGKPGFSWRAGEPMTLINAFGGNPPTWDHHDHYSTITAAIGQGFSLPLDYEIQPDTQYMLTFRLRAHDGDGDTVALWMDGSREIPIGAAGSDFETQYVPIMSSTGGRLRFTLGQSVPSMDVQFVSLVEGLQPIEF